MVTTSDACRFKECDGTGYAQVIDDELHEQNKLDAAKRRANNMPRCIYEPHEYAIPCRCLPYKTLNNGLSNASISAEFAQLRLKDYDVHRYGANGVAMATLAKRAVEKFTKQFDKIRAEKGGKGLYLWSETKGSGKTMLANILIHELIIEKARASQTVNVEYIVMVEFIEQLKASFNKDATVSKDALVRKVQTADLLVVDDLGREGDTSFVAETLYSIFNHRMVNELPTVFTSNIPIEQLETKYKDDKGRIASRIQKMAFPIQLPEYSVRDDEADKENNEMAAFLFEEE